MGDNPHFSIGAGSAIDAVIGLYNQSTILTYEVLRTDTISVPKQISIIGLDDFSLAGDTAGKGRSFEGRNVWSKE